MTYNNNNKSARRAQIPTRKVVTYRHTYTVSHKKTCHFVIDYNSGFFWSIFKLFVPPETGRNTLQKVNKIYHFTLSVFPHYLVKLKLRINSTF